MGNSFKKFPRPKEINFPEVKRKNWQFSDISQKEGSEKKLASSFQLLKSGNILISYKIRNETEFKVYSFIEIYNVPDLKRIGKYEYFEEDEDVFYVLDFAHQLKNGNIFTIVDKLYIFEGEEISQGPKEISEEIKNIYLETRYVEFLKRINGYEERQINRKARVFNCYFLLEVKENMFLYLERSRETLFLLDISNSKVKKEEIFYYGKPLKSGHINNYNLDIILQSQYYPENLYICANYNRYGNDFESVLLVFNLEKFLKQKHPNQEPLFTIEVSKSQSIMALCEYDKKYILLDSYTNGIFIIDMELKQNVAVCVPKLYERLSNSYFSKYSNRKTKNGKIYKKMIKLEDGQVLLETCEIADIREQITEQKIRNFNFFDFELSGDYLIFYFGDTSIFILKIS